MYWINTYDSKNGKTEFYCDSEADVANLPTNKQNGVKQDGDDSSYRICSKGSSCFVIDTGGVYILKSTGEWKAV